MRKQVQKERCTKIMLTKCKAVCCLYNKVQLAAAKMLDAEPAIFQFECNVPILCNDIPANDLNLPSETYTTDFVLHYDDGHTAVREAVFRSYLSRPSVAEKLELSRRYWQRQGCQDSSWRVSSLSMMIPQSDMPCCCKRRARPCPALWRRTKLCCQLPALSDAVPCCIGFTCRIAARSCRGVLCFRSG